MRGAPLKKTRDLGAKALKKKGASLLFLLDDEGGGGGGDGDGEAADAHVGSGGVVRRATAASRARYAAASQYCSEHFFQIERAAVHSYGLDSDSC